MTTVNSSRQGVKTFVLDTNVLLNDPHCINKFGGEDVIIPMVVLEEIDGFKKGHSTLAASARIVTRALDDLRERGRLFNGVKLDNGGRLIIPNLHPEVSFTNSSSKENNDNIILQCCLQWNEEYEDLILITEDINMRIRGDALGVKTEPHEDTRVEDVSFYDKVREFNCEDQSITDLYQLGWAKDSAFEDVGLNEYCVLHGHGGRHKTALARGMGDSRVSLIRKNPVYKVSARNKEQTMALDALMDPDIKLVVLAGRAGCGKTLLALAAGLEQSLNDNIYDKMMITRPIVPMGNDIGFLPGDLKEKLDPWMAPIYDNLSYLHRGAPTSKMMAGKRVKVDIGRQMVEDLIDFGHISMDALTYIRGRSISDQFVLVDEAQNLSAHEIKTIVTRIGQGTKLVITGDPFQIDNPYLDTHNNGLSFLIDRMKGEGLFASVVLLEGERSELAEVAARKL